MAAVHHVANGSPRMAPGIISTLSVTMYYRHVVPSCCTAMLYHHVVPPHFTATLYHLVVYCSLPHRKYGNGDA